MIKFLFQCLFLVFVPLSVTAQDTLRVNGKAIDDDTGEPLSFASIVIVGMAAGTYTDIDGNYDLLVPSVGTDTLMATMMGYEAVKKPLITEKLQTVNFRLRSSAMDLEGVVILAGENPANKIVKGIIRNKAKNRL